MEGLPDPTRDPSTLFDRAANYGGSHSVSGHTFSMKNQLRDRDWITFHFGSWKGGGIPQYSSPQLSWKFCSPIHEDCDLEEDPCRDQVPWYCLEGLSFSNFILGPLVGVMVLYLTNFTGVMTATFLPFFYIGAWFQRVCFVGPFQFKLKDHNTAVPWHIKHPSWGVSYITTGNYM